MIGKCVHKIEYSDNPDTMSFSVSHPFPGRTPIVSIYDAIGFQILPQFLGVKQNEIVFLLPERVNRERYPLTVVMVG